MALLCVEDLHTNFVTREGRIRAVDGISFDVHEAETLGIVGESGCGKSVTALSIMRLVPTPPGEIAGGRILYEGQDILTMSEAEVRRLRGSSVAMVYQDPMMSLNPVLSVGAQIMEALRLHLNHSKRQARSRTSELLALVGIPDAAKRLDDYPHEFSGGMRQRVMIAMAIACEPKILLADEITTALDVTIQAQILELLREIARDRKTAIVLITHDLGIVAGMAQRVNVMYAGQIVEKATTQDLFANPRMPYTWGLLKSLPRVDERRGERLTPIEGTLPDLADPPPGCRFEPRCQYRREICSVETPRLLSIADAGAPVHEVRCWGTQDVPGGGWLVGHDWRTNSESTQMRGAVREL